MATLAGGLAIGYANRADGKTITATTAATGYAASNLNSPRQATSWRSTTGSLTAQTLIADLSSAQDIDLIALLGFNGEDDATGSYTTSENSDLSSPEYGATSAASWDATTWPYLVDDAGPYGRNLIHFPGTTKNSRYIGITLADSGNPDNYLSGRVFWTGPIFQPAESFLIEQEKWAIRRVVIGSPGIQRSLRAMDFDLTMQSEVEARKLESLIATKLSTGRLLVVPRPTMPESFLSEALYCRLDLEKSPPARYIIPVSGGLRWKMSLSFLECED